MARTKSLYGTPYYRATTKREETSGGLFMRHATVEQKEQFSNLPFYELLNVVQILLDNHETISEAWHNYRNEALSLAAKQPFFYGSFPKLAEVMNTIIHNKNALLQCKQAIEDYTETQENYNKEKQEKTKTA